MTIKMEMFRRQCKEAPPGPDTPCTYPNWLSRSSSWIFGSLEVSIDVVYMEQDSLLRIWEAHANQSFVKEVYAAHARPQSNIYVYTDKTGQLYTQTAYTFTYKSLLFTPLTQEVAACCEWPFSFTQQTLGRVSYQLKYISLDAPSAADMLACLVRDACKVVLCVCAWVYWLSS